MPYIDQATRKNLDPLIAALAERIGSLGELNYAITRLAVMKSKVAPAVTYASLSAIHGVLHDTATEFYRRVMAPYEDEKMKANGDAYQ